MAAELFSTFSDFKTYVGGRVNTSLKLESLEATIYETARRHLVPWLGLTLYARLVAGSGLSAKETELLPYVRRPLAVLTMYEWSKVGGIEVGESGMHRIESETRKTVFRYQERAYNEDALEKGYNAQELMLKFLDDNKGDLTAWRDSPEGQAHLSPLLNYASDFRLLLLPECDRYTFECIRPIIGEVQSFGIEQQLPEAFWSGYITRHKTGALTDEEKVLRTYMRQAIAHRAIQEAITQRWVRVTGGRVSISEDFGDQRNTNQTMPTPTEGGIGMAHGPWSDRYTLLWQSYIKKNPDKFDTVFDTASGGTNTDADAWHIKTPTEQSEADCRTELEKRKPILRF